MRIGVISDTHGMLRPKVREAFSKVERIIHCGDVGPRHVLDHLETLAPVSVAYGNTDGFDIRLESSRVVRLDWSGKTIIALHGDQFGMPTPRKLQDEFPDADVILFGHTHKPLIELLDDSVTIMNPGAAGAVRNHCRPSVGILNLEVGTIPDARIVPLDSAG